MREVRNIVILEIELLLIPEDVLTCTTWTKPSLLQQFYPLVILKVLDYDLAV